MLTDNDLMPYGKFRGLKMANIPARYLVVLYENNKCCIEVKAYIEDNSEVLRKELIEEGGKVWYGGGRKA